MGYQGKKIIISKKRTWKWGGVFLMTLLLAACGEETPGEDSAATWGAVRLEDIRQTVSGQEEADSSLDSGEEKLYTGNAEGESGAGIPGQTGADSAAPQESGPESGAPEATMEPMDPIEEKLTPEGIGWGLGFGESGTQPTGNASPRELALYDAYFLNPGEEKVIYLTFDCGYENGNTEKILDALKTHDAPATFFVVGHFLETEPELVQRMVEEGHAVGNHTYHHYDIDTLDEAGFQKELEDVETLFREITGTELSPFYRPPEGKCGTTNLKRAQGLGYATCFWSLAYVDWDADNQPSHQAALDKLTARIHPGAIVLLHNTSKTNGEILDELLTRWEEMGYTFAPLSELTRK